MPVGLDWLIILPAVRVFLEGGNPYQLGEQNVLFPFWTFIALVPFAVLPYWIGRVLLFIVSLIAFAFTANKLGATRLQFILFLSSSAVIGCLNNGNLDWLVTLGFWMPPQMALFFVLMKPQIGLPVAIYWLYIFWRHAGWLEAVKVFAPVTGAYLLSFIMYGFWPIQMLWMSKNPENMSAFPFSVLPGLVLVYLSVRRNETNLSMFSGPLLAPYASQFSYSASLLALLYRPKLFILAWVLLWIPVLVRFYVP